MTGIDEDRMLLQRSGLYAFWMTRDKQCKAIEKSNKSVSLSFPHRPKPHQMPAISTGRANA